MALGNSVNSTSTGLQSLTSAGVFNGRTLTGTANQVAVTNGDGVSGNPTVALTSTIYVSGISFDSGSNTLSTYVLGTFTPTITNTGSAPTVTYSTQNGRYTQIGNLVQIYFQIALSAYTAGTGNVQLSSLPVTSANISNLNFTAPLIVNTVTFGLVVFYYMAQLAPNVTNIDIVGVRSAAATLNLDATGPTATSIFITTINYKSS